MGDGGTGRLLRTKSLLEFYRNLSFNNAEMQFAYVSVKVQNIAVLITRFYICRN